MIPSDALLRAIPKAELHVHVEGTLEPGLQRELAARNGLPAAERPARFGGLQGFLDAYYAGLCVLRTARDFHDLAAAWLDRAASEGVVHAELFFDPQAHTRRGVPFEAVVEGLGAALDAERRLTTRLILCFLRDLPPEDALRTFEQARPHFGRIAGVGLDSAERGNPPGPFRDVFAAARAEGLAAVAHAGEEGPPGYVREALRELGVTRIDHGIRAAEDPELLAELIRRRVPLTVCPLSNVRLGVFPSLAAHPVLTLLDQGACVTINSDDPAFLGGTLLANLTALRDELGMTVAQLRLLAANAFEASLLPSPERAAHIAAVNEAVRAAVSAEAGP